MNNFEYFHFLTYRWDITRAKAVAADLPVERFDPRPYFTWLGAVRIDEDHLAQADLSEPLILARVTELGGAMLIDGWHRLARALRDGVTDLPCVVLDAEQERRVRVFGGTETAGQPAGSPFAEQDIAAALLGEVADHFTACGHDQQTYAGLDVTEAVQQRDAVAIRGHDGDSGTAFTATVTVRVTTSAA
jgi:hypothetical protein